MNAHDISIIVIGGLNTDIVALGAKKLLGSGELTYANELKIGPGGKSRNIAQMISKLSNKTVAMIGKSSKDPYGFWKAPVDALSKSGVNTDFIQILPYEKTNKFPGIALIAVDTKGRNQIYVLPGITNDFLPRDIESAKEAFSAVAKNKGYLATTLEQPLETAIYAIKLANKFGIKVLFDPGGIDETENYSELLRQKIFLIKPNEHEARILTGINVDDFKTAGKAAEILLKGTIENVFITMGEKGGFLFNRNLREHIPLPTLPITSRTTDETGCGDQAMAAIVASLSEGHDILKAAKFAILAGTLQFYKSGIDPITRDELNAYAKF